ncbi:hypothetical protein Ndes2526B_g00084 [Nannochloris sp. 'desiccata']
MSEISFLLTFTSNVPLNPAAGDHPVEWMVQSYEPMTVPLGHIVTFIWTGNHGIVHIPTEECPTTFADNPDIEILAPESVDGRYVWNADEAGEHWFTCQVGAHCDAGQKIKVIVTA